jgi:urease accessory protein
MLAVGLIATRLGGRTLWLLPLTFLSFMIAGGLLAFGGRPVPMVEQGIAASVLVLGLMVVAGSRLATPLAVGLVGLFAIFHGYAHGAEMTAGLVPMEYGLGFLVATAALLSIGLTAGMVIKRKGWVQVAPFAGGAIALSGLLLFVM